MAPSLLGAMVIQLLLAQAQLERMSHIPIAYAAEIPIEQQIQTPPSFYTNHDEAIAYWAKKYGQDFGQLHYVIEHEGGFHDDYKNVIGLAGERGACQILPRAHPEITLEQMLDPDWCIAWTAKAWSEGHAHWWTTHWRFENTAT